MMIHPKKTTVSSFPSYPYFSPPPNHPLTSQTILITILAAVPSIPSVFTDKQAILVVFYRYAVKYIPSDTMRIPLKVFSRVSPEGMIRLPTSDEEAARMGETFPDNDSDEDGEQTFHDEDDDIPPPVASVPGRVKVQENEEDFFDVSDTEEEQVRPTNDEGTKAWRD
jgi:hypothetical protein